MVNRAMMLKKLPAPRSPIALETISEAAKAAAAPYRTNTEDRAPERAREGRRVLTADHCPDGRGPAGQ